jgi:hypothetical protein
MLQSLTRFYPNYSLLNKLDLLVDHHGPFVYWDTLVNNGRKAATISNNREAVVATTRCLLRRLLAREDRPYLFSQLLINVVDFKIAVYGTDKNNAYVVFSFPNQLIGEKEITHKYSLFIFKITHEKVTFFNSLTYSEGNNKYDLNQQFLPIHTESEKNWDAYLKNQGSVALNEIPNENLFGNKIFKKFVRTLEESFIYKLVDDGQITQAIENNWKKTNCNIGSIELFAWSSRHTDAVLTYINSYYNLSTLKPINLIKQILIEPSNPKDYFKFDTTFRVSLSCMQSIKKMLIHRTPFNFKYIKRNNDASQLSNYVIENFNADSIIIDEEQRIVKCITTKSIGFMVSGYPSCCFVEIT